MSYLREQFGLGSRPYPIDRERRRRVLVALAEHEMNISALARNIGVSKQYISAVISGRRLSSKTEQRIAAFLGIPVDDLFPCRTPEELGEMRKAEKASRGNAA